MCSSAAGFVAAFAVTVVCFQTNGINYKFTGGDWATSQPKPFFEMFASGHLAGKITYTFAKLSRNHKNIGKLLSSSSTETHQGILRFKEQSVAS